MSRCNTSISHLIGAVVASALAAGCEPPPTCDPDILADELRQVTRGSTVRAGACRIVGSFTVPDGVRLRGAGPGQTTIVADDRDGPAIRMQAGERGAEVSHLAIESDAEAGILVDGSGSATVHDVVIDATRGVGLAAEETGAIEIDNVVLTGPVTAGNAVSIGFDPTREETATHGLVLVRVAEASLRDVSASGFARFGVLFVESSTDWLRGAASHNLATGLMVHDGRAVLDSIELCDTFDGDTLIPAYGGVFTGGAEVETRNMTACNTEGIGLLQDHTGSITHHGLTVHGNEDAGIWGPAFRSPWMMMCVRE